MLTPNYYIIMKFQFHRRKESKILSTTLRYVFIINHMTFLFAICIINEWPCQHVNMFYFIDDREKRLFSWKTLHQNSI